MASSSGSVFFALNFGDEGLYQSLDLEMYLY
jgi:hypothetical protein